MITVGLEIMISNLQVQIRGMDATIADLRAENKRQAKAIVEYRGALDIIAHEPGDVDAWHKQKARRGIEHGDNALKGSR